MSTRLLATRETPARIRRRALNTMTYPGMLDRSAVTGEPLRSNLKRVWGNSLPFSFRESDGYTQAPPPGEIHDRPSPTSSPRGSQTVFARSAVGGVIWLSGEGKAILTTPLVCPAGCTVPRLNDAGWVGKWGNDGADEVLAACLF